MQKFERQKKIKKIVSEQKLGTHQEVLAVLSRFGVSTNQATLSRDLKELGITKVKGLYKVGKSNGDLGVVISKAGDNLFVIKTRNGQAMSVAVKIDDLKIKEVIGTIAGDDTIFVTTKDKSAQKKAIEKVSKFI